MEHWRGPIATALLLTVVVIERLSCLSPHLFITRLTLTCAPLTDNPTADVHAPLLHLLITRHLIQADFDVHPVKKLQVIAAQVLKERLLGSIAVRAGGGERGGGGRGG